MKRILSILSIVFAFSLNAQVTVTNATSPNFNDGVVSVDTTGTNIKKWSIYKVVNGL